MDLVGLQTFLAIVDTGSLVRASERLHAGQSTITARLQRLEEELGRPLFSRTRSGVKLTTAGMKFRQYALAITDLWQVARQETALPEGVETVVNLGCEYDLWPIAGKPMMQQLRGCYPETAFSAWPAKQYELEQWLVSGMINAALSYQPISADNCSIHELATETLLRVSNRADTAAADDPGFIYVYAGGDMSQRHVAAYSDADLARVSFGSNAWALDYLLAEGGSVYLPQKTAEPYLESGQLHRVEEAPTQQRKIYLITSDRNEQEWHWLPGTLEFLRAELSGA